MLLYTIRVRCYNIILAQQSHQDLILVDDENISIIVAGYDEGFVPNDTIRVFIENKTEHSIRVHIPEAFANGIFIDTSRGCL